MSDALAVRTRARWIRRRLFVARLRALVAPIFVAMPGCMATAGLVAGPISGPISAIRHDEGSCAVFAAIPFGIYMGFVRGLQKDKDFFATGSYVTPGTLRISEVFDPVAHLKDPRVYPTDERPDRP